MKAKPGKCYYNAYRVIQELPEYHQADYVEGVTVDRLGLLLEHAWVEKDGEVIDPTFVEDDMTYFPGLRYRGQMGLATAMMTAKPAYTRDDLPFFYRFGWGGGDSPEFMAAWEKAKGHANGLIAACLVT